MSRWRCPWAWAGGERRGCLREGSAGVAAAPRAGSRRARHSDIDSPSRYSITTNVRPSVSRCRSPVMSNDVLVSGTTNASRASCSSRCTYRLGAGALLLEQPTFTATRLADQHVGRLVYGTHATLPDLAGHQVAARQRPRRSARPTLSLDPARTRARMPRSARFLPSPGSRRSPAGGDRRIVRSEDRGSRSPDPAIERRAAAGVSAAGLPVGVPPSGLSPRTCRHRSC